MSECLSAVLENMDLETRDPVTVLPPVVQPWTSYSIPLSLSCLISEKTAIVVSISKGY